MNILVTLGSQLKEIKAHQTLLSLFLIKDWRTTNQNNLIYFALYHKDTAYVYTVMTLREYSICQFYFIFSVWTTRCGCTYWLHLLGNCPIITYICCILMTHSFTIVTFYHSKLLKILKLLINFCLTNGVYAINCFVWQPLPMFPICVMLNFEECVMLLLAFRARKGNTV